MTRDGSTGSPASEEAARWFSRLNARSVTMDDLQDFYAWRRDPANAAAYAEVERFWSRSGDLAKDPAMERALAEAKARGAKARARQGRLGGLALGFTASVLLAIGAFATWRAWIDVAGHYGTGTGEQRTVVLEDGSKVQLDTESQIAVRFDRRSRSITLLKGQAFFDVIHRADRPFEVRIGPTVIHDLGTRFDVRRTDGTVQITLVDGQIRVASAGRTPLQLAPGQQVIAIASQPPQLRSIDPKVVTSWIEGRVVFNDVTLAEATAEMNRYATHKLVLDAPGASSIKVTGTFETADTAAFVTAVSHLYGLSAHPQVDGRIVLAPADPQKAT